MRLPWLALLSMGTAALCQSPDKQPLDPDKLFQMPHAFTQQAPDPDQFRPQPFLWDKSIRPRKLVNPAPRLINPQIDPKIIIHPPWHGNAKGRDFAHHLYPKLRFLPLQRRSPGTR